MQAARTRDAKRQARLKRVVVSAFAAAILAMAMLASPSSTVAFQGHHCSKSTCRFFTSSYYTAKYFYDRRTCNQWKDLENKYLQGFKTKRALKRKFDRKLHKPC